MSVTLRVLDVTDAEQRAYREDGKRDRDAMIGRKISWSTWSGPTVATVVYLGGDGRCHLRGSDGHVEYHEHLPQGWEICDQECGACGAEAGEPCREHCIARP